MPVRMELYNYPRRRMEWNIPLEEAQRGVPRRLSQRFYGVISLTDSLSSQLLTTTHLEFTLPPNFHLTQNPSQSGSKWQRYLYLLMLLFHPIK